jgi:hypothetical protein
MEKEIKSKATVNNKNSNVLLVNMSDLLGYFADKQGQPIAFMRGNGLIVFSNRTNRKDKKPILGGSKELTQILSNPNYYKAFSKEKKQKGNTQTGAGGLFGESNGKCGWGDSPSCCFYDCAPLWKTNLWPLSDSFM